MIAITTSIYSGVLFLSISSFSWSAAEKITADPTFNLTYNVVEGGRRIQFIIEANTTGWVSFGFNENNSSLTDYFRGYFNYSGRTVVGEDYHVLPNHTHETPVKDKLQNWNVESGAEWRRTEWANGTYKNSSYTKIGVSRRLKTNDAEHDVIIGNKTLTLLWAYGSTDDLNEPAIANGTLPVSFLGSGSERTGGAAIIKEGEGEQSEEGNNASGISATISTILIALFATFIK